MLYPLDADQWRAYRGETFPADSWNRMGDMLCTNPQAPRVDLISREAYRNFVFRFEFSLAAGGNGGVLFQVSEEWPESWQSGPELQLLDNARHPDGENPLTTHGALYALQAPTAATPIEPERFMSGRLVVQGTAVEHWLNDRCVLAYDLKNTALRQAISQSKFKENPDFGLAPQGHLVLQHHGDEIRFRYMTIEVFD
ncbi:uncharacterized protein DUF1080 [Pseudomonas duriflava]|uniref:Uncharacterized protein DUF1080 n=1 Tax=Pseudomonas duriflava TaxID=459528 RepID=A0A562QLF0_9PSED|nr:DUF1080 domain-containing protein [Pseudomonas duriflava]TWI57608.1 uncharacterized protein DUF1080 [Pseudomonas duriflava]